MKNDTFSRFRIISIIEGLSYLILVFIAMPLKYMFNYPMAVKIVGMSHGVLFILFFVALVMAMNRYKWKFLGFQLFVYSLLPFGFILIEKTIESSVNQPQTTERIREFIPLLWYLFSNFLIIFEIQLSCTVDLIPFSGSIYTS